MRQADSNSIMRVIFLVLASRYSFFISNFPGFNLTLLFPSYKKLLILFYGIIGSETLPPESLTENRSEVAITFVFLFSTSLGNGKEENNC
jgi:hypothetical protein